MAKMIHSKYGYETREWIQADARLDRYWEGMKLASRQLNVGNGAKGAYLDYLGRQLGVYRQHDSDINYRKRIRKVVVKRYGK